MLIGFPYKTSDITVPIKIKQEGNWINKQKKFVITSKTASYYTDSYDLLSKKPQKENPKLK